MADENYIAANIARLRLNQQLPQEELYRKTGLLRLVRQALEQEHISLGRAAEILGLSREEMRRYAREWTE